MLTESRRSVMPPSSYSPRSTSSLTRRQRQALHVQRRISQIAALPLWPVALLWLRYVRGYRIRQLAAVRAQVRAVVWQGQGPLLISPKNQTRVDSLILQWAISSPWQLLTCFRHFAWNTPEQANFSRSVWLKGLCYVGKCLPIRRGGERTAQRVVLAQLSWLLEHGEFVMIFPEGGRTVTGRVDAANMSYGAGGIAKGVDGCRVLCVYLRGDEQSEKTILPVRDQEFSVRFALITPEASETGLRGARETARQIGQALVSLENDYFADRK